MVIFDDTEGEEKYEFAAGATARLDVRSAPLWVSANSAEKLAKAAEGPLGLLLTGGILALGGGVAVFFSGLKKDADKSRTNSRNQTSRTESKAAYSTRMEVKS